MQPIEKRSPGPRLIAAMTELLERAKSGEFDTPLPAEGESSPKPEGLKWGCKIERISGCSTWKVTHGQHGMMMTGPWSLIGYQCFGSHIAALAALNACTTPPPDWEDPAEIQYNKPKPEAGEQRVCEHVYMGRPSLCAKCGAWNPSQQTGDSPTPQPAEPKVMPPEEYGKGSIDWSKAAIVPPVSPQPSEQAKGAEWFPQGMRKIYDHCSYTANYVQCRDTQWRSFIESERAQHKAEMEAVKKGASR